MSVSKAVWRSCVAAFVAGLLAGFAEAGVVIDDAFDDGNHATNTTGTGGPYNNNVWRGSQSETGGAYVIQQTGDWGNGGMVSYEDDAPNQWDGSFDAWTADGVTATVLSGNTTVTSGTDSSMRAIFGLVDGTNDGDNQANALVAYHNRQGGIWMRIVYTKTGTSDTELAVSGQIHAAAADKSSDGVDPDKVDTLASFTIPEADWDGQGFRRFQLYVDDTGWQAWAEGAGVEWTDALVGGTTAANLYGQSWATVNANASFTTDDPGDVTDYLDDTVFATDALANIGIDGGSGRGTIRYDSWKVETGNALMPEPATLGLLALGGTAVLLRRRRPWACLA